MSGAKVPATSTEGTSPPRPLPSVRTAGRTAAAWLSVNGNSAPSGRRSSEGPSMRDVPLRSGRNRNVANR
ncbi:hypothetical protein GCM10010261_09310 [Streptomyces pilosus]|uniref:Uncharacterized protein n=1 Tax=Streptomyces pilosus TaxID=28893 RepID=A0A918ESR0_9ACTN|nr:hypothetical protein GCM10010280_02250 [Streptomyces pilosus]GGV38310.1 hypothetical protein GCM10010261_09310 [Streptomyces pilosus]